MVPERDIVGSHAVRDAPKKIAANLARTLLEVRARNRRVESLGAFDDQFNTKSRTHSAHKSFVAIRLDPSNPMVQMRRRNPESQPLAKLKDRTSKRNRISPAGKPDQYRCAPTDPRAHQGRLDRAEHDAFRIPNHHG
jgi:hypothetical protein